MLRAGLGCAHRAIKVGASISAVFLTRAAILAHLQWRAPDTTSIRPQVDTVHKCKSRYAFPPGFCPSCVLPRSLSAVTFSKDDSAATFPVFLRSFFVKHESWSKMSTAKLRAILSAVEAQLRLPALTVSATPINMCPCVTFLYRRHACYSGVGDLRSAIGRREGDDDSLRVRVGAGAGVFGD